MVSSFPPYVIWRKDGGRSAVEGGGGLGGLENEAQLISQCGRAASLERRGWNRELLVVNSCRRRGAFCLS